MLGIYDPQIWIAYVLCFLSAFGCILYGALKWNVGAEEEIEKEIAECPKRIESAEKEAAE
ncbi:symporter small accessory protein [Methanosarcina sp. MTP4]|uniref:symporter small accessory protein n=1 Tax=Methanosarcina sp. MTP4 TaxID=1434100 RepID=UPI00064FB98D|nr:symporter small accessory protein [Methanosarcina sp. MTP4]